MLSRSTTSMWRSVPGKIWRVKGTACRRTATRWNSSVNTSSLDIRQIKFDEVRNLYVSYGGLSPKIEKRAPRPTMSASVRIRWSATSRYQRQASGSTCRPDLATPETQGKAVCGLCMRWHAGPLGGRVEHSDRRRLEDCVRIVSDASQPAGEQMRPPAIWSCSRQSRRNL